MNNKDMGRVALVTGASRGIGAAAVLALARRGFTPVLAVRNPDAARDTMSQLHALGATAHVVACDVSNTASTQQAVAETLRLAGRLDVLVNNAGQIDPIGPVAFDGNGMVNSYVPPVFQIQGGRSVVVYPASISTGSLK